MSPRPFSRQLNYLPRPVSTQARWKMIFAELLPGGKCGGFDEWRDANSSLDISARNLLILTVLYLHNTKTGWRTQTIFSVIIYLSKEAREENWVRVSGYTDISSHNPPGPSEERQKLGPGECDQWSHRRWVRPWCWNGESWLVIRVEMEPPCTPEQEGTEVGDVVRWGLAENPLHTGVHVPLLHLSPHHGHAHHVNVHVTIEQVTLKSPLQNVPSSFMINY